MWIRNAWYAAAAIGEVSRSLMSRTLLGEAIVLWRTEAGDAVALRDRCAHRFAPLSQGRLDGDSVACPYHGMRYGADGRCVQVPGQDRVPPAAVVTSYPVLERYGLVFVWMGDPARADARQLLDIGNYDAPGWGISRGYALFGACMENIADNLIDPAHTSFVHSATIGNAAGEDVPLNARQIGVDTVECGRWVADAPAVPMVQRFVPGIGLTDRWQFYGVKAPNACWVDFGVLPAGSPRTAEAQAAAPYRVLSYAFLSPETASSTHYFSFQLRNVAVDDAAVTAEFERLYQLTFEEDRVLLEAIQREEDAHPGVTPVRIASDTGVVRLRRVCDTLRSTD